MAEYQIKLLNIRLSRQFSGYTRYFFWYFFWWCAFTLLDWDLQRTNIQTKGLRIQTKTQAFGTVQLLEPWRKVRQLRPILVLSFLAEYWINYKASGQLSNFQSVSVRSLILCFPQSLHRSLPLNLLIFLSTLHPLLGYSW